MSADKELRRAVLNRLGGECKRYEDILEGYVWPYQLLCANCNWIKKHQQDENTRSRNKLIQGLPNRQDRLMEDLISRQESLAVRRRIRSERSGIERVQRRKRLQFLIKTNKTKQLAAE